jgi:hypothetical protein
MALQHTVGGNSLADILERILDKGIVIAGDISVNLVGVELLTVRIRLVVASVDRAMEMGIRWWESDSALTGGDGMAGVLADASPNRALVAENSALLQRVAVLEQALAVAPARPRG